MPSPFLFGPSEDLLSSPVLERLVGEVESVRRADSQTLGYSGADFVRVEVEHGAGGTRRLFLKTTDVRRDWFSHRTGDAEGREGRVVSAPELVGIWEEIESPYLAVSVGGGVVRLLMEDVADHLLPDERAALPDEVEGCLLAAIARVHARFWNEAGLRDMAYLHRPEDLLYIMGPLDHERDDAAGWPAEGVRGSVRDGWAAVERLLPDPLMRRMKRPPQDVADSWSDLPVTLVHGDTKVANFAVLPGGAVTLFDWAFAGWAPATFDLGWYVAVNGSRLVGSKEQTISRYRACLENALGEKLEDGLWERLEEAGMVCGAFMLLWSKALGVESGRPGAQEEWGWWVARLERWALGGS